jgi:hypothetical protein
MQNLSKQFSNRILFVKARFLTFDLQQTNNPRIEAADSQVIYIVEFNFECSVLATKSPGATIGSKK